MKRYLILILIFSMAAVSDRLYFWWNTKVMRLIMILPVDKYVFRFAHEEKEGSVQDYYVKKFAELMEEKSKGEIKIKYIR